MGLYEMVYEPGSIQLSNAEVFDCQGENILSSCGIGFSDGGTERPKYCDVANRDYHQLSQAEIGGEKRISRHLSGPTCPAHLQEPVSDYATNRVQDRVLDCIRDRV
jgi:hypothetical protein